MQVKADDAKAIGLLVVTVEPQVEPIKLPLDGTHRLRPQYPLQDPPQV